MALHLNPFNCVICLIASIFTVPLCVKETHKRAIFFTLLIRICKATDFCLIFLSVSKKYKMHQFFFFLQRLADMGFFFSVVQIAPHQIYWHLDHMVSRGVNREHIICTNGHTDNCAEERVGVCSKSCKMRRTASTFWFTWNYRIWNKLEAIVFYVPSYLKRMYQETTDGLVIWHFG